MLNQKDGSTPEIHPSTSGIPSGNVRVLYAYGGGAYGGKEP